MTFGQNVVSFITLGQQSSHNNARENEELVEKFLKSHPDFSLEDFPHPLTQESTGGILRISPAPEDCDAMFAARFRRKNL